MGELNSFIGINQMNDLDLLISKQRKNAKSWDKEIKKTENMNAISVSPNSLPSNWVYGIIAKNKTETIKKFRKQGYYATSVHINNNIYSVFNNKTELKGVTEFMNHFVALPCGWWFEKINYEF